MCVRRQNGRKDRRARSVLTVGIDRSPNLRRIFKHELTWHPKVVFPPTPSSPLPILTISSSSSLKMSVNGSETSGSETAYADVSSSFLPPSFSSEAERSAHTFDLSSPSLLLPLAVHPLPDGEHG